MARKSLIVFLFLFLFVGCSPSEHFAKKIGSRVEDLEYFQDPRTGICFAYLWEGSHHGGPSLATVDCNRVPADLLRKGEDK